MIVEVEIKFEFLSVGCVQISVLKSLPLECLFYYKFGGFYSFFLSPLFLIFVPLCLLGVYIM